ncbi:MAG: hypothetical protein AAFR64_13465 [Pseudomonadota bacterium]
MHNGLLYAAGLLGVVISLIHGYLGEKLVVGPSKAPTLRAKRVMRAIMFLSALYWFAAGALLLATPDFLAPSQRALAVIVAAFLFATGSLSNLWATRGGHIGWALLAFATGLAVAGA